MNYLYFLTFIIILLAGSVVYLLFLFKNQQNDNQEQNILINTLKEKLIQSKNENLLLQQKALFVEKQSEKMIEQFKSLSHETVASQSFSFIKVIEDHIHKIKTSSQEENTRTHSSIKEILNPIENTINNFEKVIHHFESKTSIDNREIFNKLSQVVNTSHNLQQEVNKVINSLRSPNVKGIWGEMQLKRLVQLCGMEEHCDFQWQSTIEKGLKPDMVINLPNSKQIIVDSKVSLSAYINCMDTNDDEKKKYYMQDHARQIKQHINVLHSKKYWEVLDHSANFVILFLPGECFLSTALEVSPSLIEYAIKYNIIIATPTTMIGLLKTIAYGWENIHISRDIEKIKNILQNLYGELTTVIDDMASMGKIIDSLNKVYKSTYNTIDGNLKYTLDEIHNKYSITFSNNIKEDQLKKTRMKKSDEKDQEPINEQNFMEILKNKSMEKESGDELKNKSVEKEAHDPLKSKGFEVADASNKTVIDPPMVVINNPAVEPVKENILKENFQEEDHLPLHNQNNNNFHQFNQNLSSKTHGENMNKNQPPASHSLDPSSFYNINNNPVII
jgi:DNA recombination protein RmuC